MTSSTGADSDFADCLFARGYILSQCPIERTPIGWRVFEFGGYQVAHDKRLTVVDKVEGDARVVSLGIVYDIRSAEDDTSVVIGKLAACLQQAEKSFLDQAAFCGGRHILLYESGTCSASLITDATGMKSAFYYNQENRVISSHAELLSRNVSHAPRKACGPISYGYPGVQTPFQGIYLLSPNSKLELATHRTSRFWPLQSIESLELDDAADLARRYLKVSMDWIYRRHEPLLSITAGLDSRVTLSLNRSRARDIRFFTYYKNTPVASDILDRAFSQRFIKDFGTSVDVFCSSEPPPPEGSFLEILRKNALYCHAWHLAWIYFRRFGSNPRALHVRSNVSEVGREFYRPKNISVTKPTDLARLYLDKQKTYPADYVIDAVEKFQELSQITGLFDCAKYTDVQSLFYWEFRMADWHAQVVAESDAAFDTVTLYNCRRILQTMLAVPREAREKGLVLQKVIEASWPELTRYPVNGKDFWSASK